MKFFIDHKYKRIHQKQFAGDRCSFVKTPVTEREFTDSTYYIEELELKRNYKVCPYCQSAQIIIE